MIELARDEYEVVSLFLALDTQWRRHPMSGARLGIDYTAIEPTARLMGLEAVPGLLPDLRVMEIAALDVLAARAQA